MYLKFQDFSLHEKFDIFFEISSFLHTKMSLEIQNFAWKIWKFQNVHEISKHQCIECGWIRHFGAWISPSNELDWFSSEFRDASHFGGRIRSKFSREWVRIIFILRMHFNDVKNGNLFEFGLTRTKKNSICDRFAVKCERQRLQIETIDSDKIWWLGNSKKWTPFPAPTSATSFTSSWYLGGYSKVCREKPRLTCVCCTSNWTQDMKLIV